jgi:hypothetical protein
VKRYQVYEYDGQWLGAFLGHTDAADGRGALRNWADKTGRELQSFGRGATALLTDGTFVKAVAV